MPTALSRSELRRALTDVVGEARVSIRDDDRDTYSRDMWPKNLLAVRDGRTALHPPDAVVWPESEDEVVALVRLARRLRVPIVPYGAGSGVCGGAVPIFGGITIDLKRLNKIRSIDSEALVVDVDAGLNGQRFEDLLNQRGLTAGHFPSSIYCSTVGGWIAARGAGQMSTKYGKIEDMVLSMRVVTGRGELVEVGQLGRAAAGPDWLQLLVGSEGTLGIITSARLRVRPAPATRLMRAFEVPSVLAGLEAIRRVLQKDLRPAVVRLYDEFDTVVHLRDKGNGHKPPPRHVGALPSLEGSSERPDGGLAGALARVFAGEGGARQRLVKELLGAALERPRLLNLAAEAIAPRLGRRGCLLILGVEGARARTEVEAELIFAEVARAGGKDLGAALGERWLAHRYAVSYNMSKMFEAGAFVDTMEVASTWERLPDLFEETRKAIGAHAFVMAHFSHAYGEGCSIYFTFAAHAPSRAAADAKYDAIWRDGLAAVTRAGGTISHHHGVGLLKGPAMAAEHREAMAIYQALKRSLDPDHILNPGKMGLPVPKDVPWASISTS